ncbi:MAG: sigma-70 family RNA polymerase sigma factor [Deltaproteobacteria bacterium]|nr:sigma-70 family RNA polymerase sigma factor [Deltaproteobacteria bacterium]
MGVEPAIANQPTAADPVLDRIATGDHRGALELCARQHGDSIGRLCMALLGSQAEADETVQEVLLAAYQAFPSYRADGTIRAFLFGIARKMCARRLETRVRRDRRLRLVHDAERDGGMPDHLADLRRQADRLRGALEELKPSERDAVVLRFASGLSYREVAEACGIEEAAARQRTSRALVRLRALLEEV